MNKPIAYNSVKIALLFHSLNIFNKIETYYISFYTFDSLIVDQ